MQKSCNLGCAFALIMVFLAPLSQISAKYIDSRDLGGARAELSKLIAMMNQSPALAGGIRRIKPLLSREESPLLNEPHQRVSRGQTMVFPQSNTRPSQESLKFSGRGQLSDDRGFYVRYKNDEDFARKITNILLGLVFSDEDYLAEASRLEANISLSQTQKLEAFYKAEEERRARLRMEAAAAPRAERRRLSKELKRLGAEGVRAALIFEKQLRKESADALDASVRAYYQAYEKSLLPLR